jgi:hypothetical protein
MRRLDLIEPTFSDATLISAAATAVVWRRERV